MDVTIHVYAGLKDYFKPQITLDIIDKSTVKDLFLQMTALRPESKNTLDCCKAVVQKEFVNEDYILSQGEEILLFPPSSGG